MYQYQIARQFFCLIVLAYVRIMLHHHASHVIKGNRKRHYVENWGSRAFGLFWILHLTEFDLGKKLSNSD